MKPDQKVLRAFNVTDTQVEFIEGGEGRTYRADDIILRKEANDFEANFYAELYDRIQPQGFRIPKPIKTIAGTWVTGDLWSAWTFVAGQAMTPADLPSVIPAIQSFHQSIADIPYPDYRKQSQSPFDRADKATWTGDYPNNLNPEYARLLEKLTAYHQPLPLLTEQLIHGDLNPDNILIAPNMPPAIIDIAPYWRPANFALAICAFWVGAYHDNPQALTHFRHIPHFDQLLLRAGIRMLLIKHEFGQQSEVVRYERAFEIICQRIIGE